MSIARLPHFQILRSVTFSFFSTHIFDFFYVDKSTAVDGCWLLLACVKE